MKKYIFFSLIMLLFGFLGLRAQDPEHIRIGVFLDMTGQTSNFGISTYNGITLATNEINALGGINGRKIELYLEDTKGRPEDAKRVVQKLIAQRVHVVIGEVASTNSLAAGPEAQEAQIPMITPSSTNPKVTEVGHYVFRICFIDPFQGAAMAKFAFNNLSIKRVAILRDANSDYSRGLATAFRDTFQKLRGKVSIEESYYQTDTAYKRQLRKIRRTKPEAIYLAGYYGQVGIIAKQSRELGMNIPLLGGDGWNSPELWKLGGRYLRNSYMSGHFAPDDPSTPVQTFVKKYAKDFGEKPDELAALGYDAVYLFGNAVRRTNSTDGPTLRNAIAATRDFIGVTGKISLNAARDAVKPVVIYRLDEIRREFRYQTTIQP